MSSSSGDDGSDWEEVGEEAITTCHCLFCDVVDSGAQLVLNHCCQQHSFDLQQYTRRMREYINYSFNEWCRVDKARY